MLTPHSPESFHCCSMTTVAAAVAEGPIRVSPRSVCISCQRCRRTCANLFIAGMLITCFAAPILAQKKRVPPGGNIAVVADERLAALRSRPTPSARLIRRLGRGTFVSVRGARRNYEGLLFFYVAITRRTSGWVQSEALVSSRRTGDDRRLALLIDGIDEFERVARARIFLNTFPRSPLRAQVLLALGDAAEEAAQQLTREATRRFERRELPAVDAPEFSYYLNYSGLDRYNRQGVMFIFDRGRKKFHYDGAAWKEIVRRFPLSREAVEAKNRLEKLLRPNPQVGFVGSKRSRHLN